MLFRQFTYSNEANNIYLQLSLDGNHDDGCHHLYFNKYTGKIVNDVVTGRSRNFEFKKTSNTEFQSFQKQWYRDRINRLDHDLISGNTSAWFYHLIDGFDVDFIMERNDSLFVISRNSGGVSDISEVHELIKSVTYLWRGDARMKENGTAFWYESLIDNYPYANRYDSAFVMGNYDFVSQEIDSVSIYFDKETSIHQYEWINDRLHFYMNRGDTAIWSIYDLYGQQLWTKEFLSFQPFRLKNVELVDDGYIISGKRDGKMYMAKYKKSESLSVALGSDRLENEKASSFVMSPNPSDNQFRISFGSELRNVEMQILNMKGQLIISKTISDNEKVDISGLNSGVYIVKIKSESEQSVQTKKLIIQ
ncbi:MAG: T9SS type A sorting domain-containing protein [Salibacter sp.]|uniref:T9SS type A sorting domain-containing protein n=1 Tax=Salibacter sp. TaxID=2010995 RepID=UPI00286FC0E0|nr:T9SS type A sorting domain-containing protein [Salibacter sp.]MDR9398413.1 T9SS type A sorting domain-containing protein [Salibacter sp.]